MPVGWLAALHVCAYGKSLRSKKFISAHMVEEKSTLHAATLSTLHCRFSSLHFAKTFVK